MNTYGDVDAKIHIFLIPVLVVEWSASGLGGFTRGNNYLSLSN
jgi:hypothetical protein